MNTHLNQFKSYAKQSRQGYQLEDDLTRALAITLQENDVFSHQFLKYILNHEENFYGGLFDDYNGKEAIEVDIQKPVNAIEGFDYLFAVRISGAPMEEDFFDQTREEKYNAITDMYIRIHNIAIIFEVKPDNTDSTAQLYNQAFNTVEGEAEMRDMVTPVDFNWPKLMQLAVRVNNYQEANGKPSRILNDFISYIKMHNYTWLPQLSLSALSYSSSRKTIIKRISDAIENSDNPVVSNRLAFKCDFGWAEEVLINLDKNEEEIKFSVYPGNTKKQGWSIFKDEGEPQFKKALNVNGAPRELHKRYHIKFSGQRFITGLWAGQSDFKSLLYTKENFKKHSGRKKRGTDWEVIKELLDSSFELNYDWKKKCDWDNKIMGSNRSQFDISFGYEINFKIPYSELQKLDTNKDDLQPLINLLEEVKNGFKTILGK